MNFIIFYQVNLTGSGLYKYNWCRNRLFTFKKDALKSFFIIEKIKRYLKCPALGERRGVNPTMPKKLLLYRCLIYTFQETNVTSSQH